MYLMLLLCTSLLVVPVSLCYGCYVLHASLDRSPEDSSLYRHASELTSLSETFKSSNLKVHQETVIEQKNPSAQLPPRQARP